MGCPAAAPPHCQPGSRPRRCTASWPPAQARQRRRSGQRSVLRCGTWVGADWSGGRQGTQHSKRCCSASGMASANHSLRVSKSVTRQRDPCCLPQRAITAAIDILHYLSPGLLLLLRFQALIETTTARGRWAAIPKPLEKWNTTTQRAARPAHVHEDPRPFHFLSWRGRAAPRWTCMCRCMLLAPHRLRLREGCPRVTMLEVLVGTGHWVSP
jgi:hypothetical protein